MGSKLISARIPERLFLAVESEKRRQFANISIVVRQALAEFFQLDPDAIDEESDGPK